MLKFLFASLLAAISYGQASVKDCNTGSVFAVTGLAFSPSIPIAGENITLSLAYKAPSEVSAGTVDYKCDLNGLPVWSDKMDLCTQTVCPIASGQHNDISESPVPNVSGKVVCTIKWSDLNGKNLLCIESVLKITGQGLRGSLGSGENKLWPMIIPSTAVAPYDPLRTSYKNVEKLRIRTGESFSNGSTCPAHPNWKLDLNGQKIEMPSEHY